MAIAAAAAAIAVILFTVYRPPFLVDIDNDIYDVLTRSDEREPPSGRVVIVDIDERSLAEVGQWPWPRDIVARLVDRIRDGGASVVALDIVFPERDREARSPGEPASADAAGGEAPAAGETRTDLVLAQTLRQGRVVLGYAMTFDDAAPRRPCVLHPLPAPGAPPDAGTRSRFYSASGAICSLPVLAEAAGASGFLNAAPDADGILRRVPLVIESDDRLYPSLSLAAVLAMTKEREIGVGAVDARTTRLTVGRNTIPLDAAGNVLVRFLGRERTFPYVSAADVLGGRAGRDAFAGKLVVVGATALGTQEDIATPVQPLFPGVEIQATVADGLLSGRAVWRAGYAAFAEALLVFLAIPMAWTVWRAGAGRAAALFVGIAALLWLGAERLFARGFFASPALGIAGLATAYVGAVIVRLREERRHEAVRADEAAREAAAAASMADDVLRKTSHELRTPLTVIAGWAHLLGVGTLSDRQKNAALATIRENVRTQTRLIEDLVNAAKAADGTLRLELRRVDVRDVARPLIASYAGVFARKRIRFDTAIDTVPCVVAGDPERLDFVIDALLSNASKFAQHDGAVALRIGRMADRVEIEVKDNGIGIAPDFMPLLFDRFRQQQGQTPDPRGGLGLGLTIARKILELHGGTIRAESEGVNKGATFIVWLPVAGGDV